MIVNPNEPVHTGFGIVANRTLFSDHPKTILLEQSHQLAKFQLGLRPERNASKGAREMKTRSKDSLWEPFRRSASIRHVNVDSLLLAGGRGDPQGAQSAPCRSQIPYSKWAPISGIWNLEFIIAGGKNLAGEYHGG
jgi:hypothetical protein